MGQARLTEDDNSRQWPKALKEAARGLPKLNQTAWQPELVRMGGPSAAAKLEKLVSSRPVTGIADVYDEQLAELFISQNAQLYKANIEVKRSSVAAYLVDHYAGKPAWEFGTWVYYPWSGRLAHVLDEERFTQLVTLRNQFLITPDEQQRYGAFRVGCAGLSVGSNGAWAIALTGGSRRLKLADGAVLAGSNLNRLRAGVADIGQPKGAIMARQLYELNPYLEIDVSGSLDAASAAGFFTKPWQIDVIVDEIDDLEMKVRLRLEAKKRGIPVIMVTEPADNIMLDVERFDLDPGLPLFHGLVPGIEQALASGELSQRKFVKYASRIIGIGNLPVRAQQAMLKVGATMPSPPQLGSTAMLAGGVIAYAVRQLALDNNLRSGRQHLSLDHQFVAGSRSLADRLEHRRHSRSLRRALDLM